VFCHFNWLVVVFKVSECCCSCLTIVVSFEIAEEVLIDELIAFYLHWS